MTLERSKGTSRYWSENEKILFRIQNLRSALAGSPEIETDLVHLVEHENRVIGAATVDFLDDATGRARYTCAGDPGSPPRRASAEGKADELSPQRAGNGFARLVFPTPGGPTKQRMGPSSFPEGADRQVLQNPLLDFQIIVVLIENRFA
jgi:hypothetical protein